MALSLTQHTLDKLENLLNALGYRVRYEKGNFKTGTCLIDKNRMIIVNKFSNLESRISALRDLILQTNADESGLDEKQAHFLYTLKQTTLQL